MGLYEWFCMFVWYCVFGCGGMLEVVVMSVKIIFRGIWLVWLLNLYYVVFVFVVDGFIFLMKSEFGLWVWLFLVFSL